MIRRNADDPDGRVVGRIDRVPPDVPLFTTLVASRPPRERRSGLLATATAVLVHASVVGLLFWATINVGQAIEPEPLVMLLPPRPEPPAPRVAPREAPRDVPVEDDVPGAAQPISAPIDVPLDIPLPDPGIEFDMLDYTGLLPVGDPEGTGDSAVTADDVDAAPIFTPMTVRPTIRNMDEVARALQQYYPPLLRDAGIDGTVVVWFLIDEQGDVVRTQVQRSSGHAALDDAALRVGDVIDFTPALNRDRAVRVWIQWPIAFRVSR